MLNIKNRDFETKYAAQYKWDFFYAMFIEGIIDILLSIADVLLFFVNYETPEEEIEFIYCLLAIRVVIILFTMHQATRFIYNKHLLDYKMQNHAVLF